MLARLLATRLLHRHGYCIAHGYYIDTVIVLKHGYCVEHDYPIEGCPAALACLAGWVAGLVGWQLAGLAGCWPARLLGWHGYCVDTVIWLARLLP